MNEWKKFIGKKVFIETKTGRRYSGKVISFEDHMFKILGKYGETVFISIEQLNILEEKE